MKVITSLPNRNCFVPENITSDWWIFKDVDCSVKLYSKIPDPFAEEGCILFSLQNKKSDNTLYPYNLILKFFPLDESNKNEKREILCREKYKAQFPHILGQTSLSFHFPTANQNLWISYFTYQK